MIARPLLTVLGVSRVTSLRFVASSDYLTARQPTASRWCEPACSGVNLADETLIFPAIRCRLQQERPREIKKKQHLDYVNVHKTFIEHHHLPYLHLQASFGKVINILNSGEGKNHGPIGSILSGTLFSTNTVSQLHTAVPLFGDTVKLWEKFLFLHEAQAKAG